MYGNMVAVIYMIFTHRLVLVILFSIPGSWVIHHCSPDSIDPAVRLQGEMKWNPRAKAFERLSNMTPGGNTIGLSEKDQRFPEETITPDKVSQKMYVLAHSFSNMLHFH